MDTSVETSVRCMLRFGFPPDFEQAEAYLSNLLQPALNLPPQGWRPMHALLEEIVGEAIEKAQADRIVIPLSEGLDSRAILGAALRCVPKERILCVTFGRETHADVVGARTVCTELDLDWRWIDVATIPWSEAAVVEGVRTAFGRFRSYAAQTVVRLMHMEREVGPEALFLSGYLGGVVTGGHLKHEANRPARAVNAFLRQNASYSESVAMEVEPLAARLEAFAAAWKPAVRQSRGLTYLDILVIGFRQALRIRGAVSSYGRVALPFEDPRWVRFWSDQDIADRLRQLRYIEDMRAAYPEVFCLPRDVPPVAPPPYRGLRTIARQQFLRPEPVAAALRRKAGGGTREAKSDFRDFEINASCRDTYAAMLAALDRRGILAEVNFSDRLATFAKQPSKRNLDYITNGVRTEAHLQAGTLTGIAEDRWKRVTPATP